MDMLLGLLVLIVLAGIDLLVIWIMTGDKK
jgi:hypothetical protein